MNRRALRPKLLLKFRGWKVAICKIDDCKIGIRSRDPFDFLKIIEVIRRDEEPSIFSQRLANRA